MLPRRPSKYYFNGLERGTANSDLSSWDEFNVSPRYMISYTAFYCGINFCRLRRFCRRFGLERFRLMDRRHRNSDLLSRSSLELGHLD